ncbi:helix-turn-helix transcriptional regulator [Brevibacillus laterosporus]|uniref:Helix-turn-helix transcriptional regulator n=1 Tax=Brevibacillus halotolerans TaxID=1507437 RepID=A0ABT4I3K5_9BACL|nr:MULTISPECIES: helix-turn-helix transcriptional regulator [Brevibacillus]MCR8987894.1 helix-turn-helix transcriptional regulator [Brevibacillus laterosporus]MCZ0833633.1 helix-turn-helix transcriptional regulator [Brevibacillus halotolerans]
MALGERLKASRKAKKLTQADLSKLVGINRSTYAKYEIGINEPDNDTLQKLADFFGVSIDYLLGRVIDPSRTLNQDVRLFVDSLELTDEEILKKINLINIDGKPLTKEEALEFIAFVRAKRMINK